MLKDKNLLNHYLIMFTGALILSFGLFNVHSQCNITDGGLLGIELLLRYWFNLSPSVTGVILDFTCYFIGWRLLGNSFLKNAIFSSISFSMSYRLWENIGYILPDMTGNQLLAAITGGLFVGIGVGLVVLEGGASGGDDALALVISKVFGWRIYKSFLIMDLTVLGLSLTYIPLSKIIFSLVTVTISSLTVEKMQNLKLKLS